MGCVALRGGGGGGGESHTIGVIRIELFARRILPNVFSFGTPPAPRKQVFGGVVS